jgi:AraC-like DNA-binding protein
MPESVWRRMGSLTLQQAPVAIQFRDPETVASDLQAAFTVLDVGACQGDSAVRLPPPFRLRSATAAHGEVVVSTFAGSALHSHLRSDALAFFVLPGRGIGHYRLLGERISVIAGETVGYLPPCEFAVTNTVTGGTLIGFTLASLQRRFAAIRGTTEVPASVVPELLRPLALPLQTPQQVFLVHTVLHALELIDQAIALSTRPPAVLALDDLILRSIALLLAAEQPPPAPWPFNGRSLDEAVDLAMGWMLAHLDRPISLTDLEQQVGYSRRALQLAFRRRVGCGPIQWLRRQRLEAAHSLLAAAASGQQPPLSMAEVGRRCGYINASAFSRDFAQRYGVPPSRVGRSESMQSRWPP